MVPTYLFGVRKSEPARRRRWPRVADAVEEASSFEHTIAPRLRFVVEDSSCPGGLLQRAVVASGARPVGTLGCVPEKCLATARCLEQRDVGQLHQHRVQEAHNLNGLASLFNACGHRWPAQRHVGRVGLLLAQGHGIQCPVCTPIALRTRIFSSVCAVVLWEWRWGAGMGRPIYSFGARCGSGSGSAVRTCGLARRQPRSCQSVEKIRLPQFGRASMTTGGQNA